MKRGRYFLFEHPAHASSWQIAGMQELADTPGVQWARADLCEYGLETQDAQGTLVPAKKPTGFLTNSWCMADELSKRCSGLHQHQHLMGGRAAAAAEYSVELCEAMCRGLRRQKDYDASGKASTRSLTRGEVKMVLGQLVKQEDEARRKGGAQVMSRKKRMEYRRSLLSELLDTDRLTDG